MSKMIGVIIDEITAKQTTEDNFLNDRDEVYFVAVGAVASGGTGQAEPIHIIRRPPGSEGKEDYWGLHNSEKATDIWIVEPPGLDLHPGDAAYLVVAIREQDNAQLTAIEKTIVGSAEVIAGIVTLILTEGKDGGFGADLIVQGGGTLLDGAVGFVNSLSSDGDQTIGAFDVRIGNDNENITVAMGGVTDMEIISQGGGQTELKAHGSNADYGLRVSAPTLGSESEPKPPRLKGTSHSGPFIQSKFGKQGNFELIASLGSRLLHFFRDNDGQRFPWHKAATLYNAAPHTAGPILTTLPFPAEATLIQSNFFSPGNLEVIGRMSLRIPDDQGDTLGFFFMDSGSKRWFGPYAIIVEGQHITHVTGNPVLIESTYGKESNNFELLVPQGNQVMHYFRDNGTAGFLWHRGGELPMPAGGGGGAIGLSPTAIALIQSNFNEPGNLEAIVQFTPAFDSPGGDTLAFYFRDSKTLQWSQPDFFRVDGQPITGVTGKPALIQSTLGGKGNFELLVPKGDRVVHYFRDNDAGFLWQKGGELPIPVGGGGPIALGPTAVALIQSNFNNPGNLEAVVRMTPVLDTGQGDSLAFYFRDSRTLKWSEPAFFTADGKPITGVTAF